MDREETQETYKFIRTMDLFFDCLNVKIHCSQSQREKTVVLHITNVMIGVSKYIYKHLFGYFNVRTCIIKHTSLWLIIAVVKERFFGLSG